MKNYEDFKAYMLDVQKKLAEQGKHVIFKRWQRVSAYQRARYTAEHCCPEVWVYRKDGGRGMCITGEDILQYEKIHGKESAVAGISMALF